jgi:hypothetical protein
MKQETLFSMFCGALAAAGAYGLYKAGKWTTVAVGDLSRGLVGIGVMAEQNEKLAENSMLVATELQLLRSVISGNVPQPITVAEPGEAPGGTGPADPTQNLKPFPVRPTGMYRAVEPVKEATIDDSAVYETEDEKMVAYEKLEQLRQTGAEVDSELLDEELQGNV